MHQKLNEEGWWGFLNLCLKAKSPEKLKQLLDLFLTIEEKETVAQRYLIIKALQEGKLTQRKIADHFGVSISQITRGSNALKIIDASLKKTLESLK
ncbi:MAG TPA: trp operon repressor [Chlamydiales bacterium]|nr:trp operon repressor [Chlamydiales bacterium]